jgi:hypothetical protein
MRPLLTISTTPTTPTIPTIFRPRRRLATASLLLLVLVIMGCEGADEGQLFDLSATGEIEATLFVDLDLDGAPDAGDPRPSGQTLAFRFQGVRDTVATATTGTDGVALATALPVGAYRVSLPAPMLGDSLRVVGQVPDPVRVTPEATVSVAVALSFFQRTPGAIRQGPAGQRVFVQGVALNASGQLPGGAVHLRGVDGAIRTEITAGPAVAAGDTIRVLGRVTQVGPGIVLAAGRVVRLSDPETPAPVAPRVIGSGSVALAGGVAPPAGGETPAPGSLDGELVRVADAQVLESSTQDGVVTARIDDGSGSGVVRIPVAHLAAGGFPTPTPGAVLSLVGVLLPEPPGPGAGSAGRWILRTRSGADVEVEARGTLRGRVFEDRNGTNAFDAGDVPLEGVGFRILPAGVGGEVAVTLTSGADGRFSTASLPVGSYTVEPVAETLPSGLSVRALEPSPVVVTAGAAVDVVVALGFPTLSPAAARDLPSGAGAFVRGVVLNAPGAHGDGAVHLLAEGQALRIPGILPPSVQPGDQVRVRGTLGRFLGQPVLEGGQPFIEGSAAIPAPTIVSSGEAAAAAGGSRDAQLVQVRDVVVQEVLQEGEVWRVRVDDGSGDLVVRVHLAGAGLTPAQAASLFDEGRRITVRGILVPFAPPHDDDDDGATPPGGPETPAGWEIRPRTAADLEIA